MYSTYLRNKLVVGAPHCHRPEEGLQVVGELAAASVLFTGRVERNEDARVQIDVDFSTEQPCRGTEKRVERKRQNEVLRTNS